MKIPVKNLYLIAIISIGLIGLAVGSTYAMFTATAEINNPISLASNLTYTSDIVETVDVSVAPGEIKSVTLDVSNSSGVTLNYAMWYICDDSDVEFGTEVDQSNANTSDVLNANDQTIAMMVYIRNNSTSTITVTLGVSSSTGNVILADNMHILPNEALTSHTVTIKRQLGTASATTIRTSSVYSGNNSSQVSVTGTSAYPTYESISCTNGQTASVTKTTSGGVDTAKVTVNNVKSDTVCTAKFKSSVISHTINIYLDTELIGTCVANHGDTCYETFRIDYDVDPISLICDNNNQGSVSFYQVDDRFLLEVEILNVSSDDNCSVEYIS